MISSGSPLERPTVGLDHDIPHFSRHRPLSTTRLVLVLPVRFYYLLFCHLPTPRFSKRQSLVQSPAFSPSAAFHSFPPAPCTLFAAIMVGLGPRPPPSRKGMYTLDFASHSYSVIPFALRASGCLLSTPVLLPSLPRCWASPLVLALFSSRPSFLAQRHRLRVSASSHQLCQLYASPWATALLHLFFQYGHYSREHLLGLP